MTTTVLLWGDRWWIEGRDRPVVFGELARAADTLLAEFGEARPPRVRLIYQPPTLVATSVACPNGNRAILRAALGGEFPTLTNDALAWGFEPIFGGHARFSTVLYRETEPGLYALVAALRASGIEIEGVWPLPTLLNHVPEDWPDSGALTVLAIAAGQALVYRHSPEGHRDVQCATGRDVEALVRATIAATPADGRAASYVAALDDAGQELVARFTPDDGASRLVPWARLVTVARALSGRQPTQLLPPPAWHHPHRVIAVATAAALLAALTLGGLTAREAWHRRLASDENAAEVRKLHRTVEHLRANEREIARLRTELATLAPARTACAEVLRALARHRPPQVAVTRLHADHAGFTIAGGVASPGLTDAAWRNWLHASLAAHPQWKLAATPPMPSADFTVKGTWP